MSYMSDISKVLCDILIVIVLLTYIILEEK